MPVRFRCPCGQKLKTADATAGKRAKCPKCENWLLVPQSNSYSTIAKQAKPPGKPTGKQTTADQAVRPAQTKPATPKAPAEKDESKGRLVVADGDPDDLATICDLLRNHGYAVSETTDGGKAIELIRSETPDAAVLDVQIENLGGFQVVRQVRDVANELNKDVWKMPILMTTAKLRGRDKQYAMSVGVQGFFDKPVNPANACSRLEKEIAKYREL